jgi:carboxymethylenebutenolidase
MEDKHVALSVSDGTEMRAYVAHPDGAGPHPGLIVLQEAFGVNEHIRDVTRRFAREGYIAIAPELFHRTVPPGFEASYDDLPSVRPHMQAMTREGTVADLEASFTFLQQQPNVNRERIAAVGFCLGGRTALTANAHLPLYAAVSFYGGGSPALQDRPEKLSGKMLLFWGLLDKHLDATVRATVSEALAKAAKKFTWVEFSDADHGFFCDMRSAYNPEAARLAWTLTVEFLKT